MKTPWGTGRISCIAFVRPIATNVARMCLSVCLSVCVFITRMCCEENGLTDRKPVRVAGWCKLREPFIRWRSRSTHERGNLGGWNFRPIKSTESLCCGICSKRDHLIVSTGMQQQELFNAQWRHDSATAAADCNDPDWSMLHYTFPVKKSASPATRPFVKNSLTACYNFAARPKEGSTHCEFRRS